MHRVDPDLYSEFQAIICGLRTFKGRGARGITSPRCFGLILLRTPTLDFENDDPVLYFLDHITHETSHLVLHGIMNRDRLIENGFTGRFKAPMSDGARGRCTASTTPSSSSPGSCGSSRATRRKTRRRR